MILAACAGADRPSREPLGWVCAAWGIKPAADWPMVLFPSLAETDGGLPDQWGRVRQSRAVCSRIWSSPAGVPEALGIAAGLYALMGGWQGTAGCI